MAVSRRGKEMAGAGACGGWPEEEKERLSWGKGRRESEEEGKEKRNEGKGPQCRGLAAEEERMREVGRRR